MCSLRLQTSVCRSFHQRALLTTRNKVGVFYSLVSLNQQTDGTHQPRVGPVPLAICKWVARRLVWPLTHGRVPAQQSHPLCYPTTSIPARHRTYFSHGLWTLTEPLQSRDSQRVYRKDENGNRKSKVHDLQSTRRHKEVLQLMQNSSSSVQPRRQSLPQCIRYPNHVPFAETLASTAQPLCSGMEDWTYRLSPTTLDEATPSSVQCREAHSGSRWPNYRMQNRGLSTAHSHQRRSRVGSGGNTRQLLALEKIPVPYQVERIQL